MRNEEVEKQIKQLELIMREIDMEIIEEEGRKEQLLEVVGKLGEKEKVLKV